MNFTERREHPAAKIAVHDQDEGRIDFANRNLAQRFPHLTERLAFCAIDATSLPADQPFDVIVSKDTFEHVDDVASLLKGLGQLLGPE